MHTPSKVDFHGAPPNETPQRVIRDHETQLERISSHLISSHVTVTALGEHHGSGGLYEVHVHLSLAGGAAIDVERLPRLAARQFGAAAAIDDAFRRARRQLQDHIRRVRIQ
jgi:sigma 54 modulation/S30EA-like ribosomal protein